MLLLIVVIDPTIVRDLGADCDQRPQRVRYRSPGTSLPIEAAIGLPRSFQTAGYFFESLLVRVQYRPHLAAKPSGFPAHRRAIAKSGQRPSAWLLALRATAIAQRQS